jgi:cyanate permease
MFCIIDGLIGVGTIVIPLILVLVGTWRNTMLTWAAVCLVFALLWMVLGRDRFTPEYRASMRSQVDTPLRSILRYKQTWLLGLGIFGSMMGMTAYKSFWPTFAHDDLAFSITAAGFVLGFAYIAMAPTELAVSAIPFLMRRRWTVLFVSGIAQCVSFIGLLSTDSLPLLLVFGMVNGAGLGYIPVVFTMLYQRPGIKPREVAVAIGLVYTLLWSGGALGPLVVGFVQEATDSLKLGLLLTGFGPLTLTVAGLLVSEKGERFTTWALSRPRHRVIGVLPK